ncbi:MAG: 1-acyl-sn-glycerol-3-phosphate acyltransferase [Clostridiales Family XIII bacterium]|jgi:1-acyl-sn-glycerol-3-phosphate acyltransferase|nr:1-acyl-sn-glycerol-3-phosphate acyltransferase [Clostridiales Family XIII bacterium]
MKMIRNLPFLWWMVRTLTTLISYKKAIRVCREKGDWEGEREAILLASNYWSPRTLKRFGVTVDVEGADRIPEGGVLFVSNHQGYGDIFVFLDVLKHKQTGFIAKDSLMKVPVFGKWMLRIRSLILARGNPREALKIFKEGAQWLKNGFSLVIFPEGHRSRSAQMDPFRKGSIQLATQAGVPVVPVSIMGTWRLFEEKGYVRGGAVKVYIHTPIPTEGLSRKEIGVLSEQVEATIRAKVDEWIKEETET